MDLSLPRVVRFMLAIEAVLFGGKLYFFLSVGPSQVADEALA